MPTATYTPLANITLGSAAGSIVLTSISQAYRDLILVWNGKSTQASGSDLLAFQINADSASNYSFVRMTGDGSSAASYAASASTGGYVFIGNTSSGGANVIYQFMDYSATDKHKTILGRGNDAATYTTASATRWANTAAITTLWIFPNSYSNFAAGTTLALYGIAS